MPTKAIYGEIVIDVLRLIFRFYRCLKLSVRRMPAYSRGLPSWLLLMLIISNCNF